MASESEMMSDLATADSAGDTQLAQRIAGQIKQLRAQAPPTVGGGEAALAGLTQGASFGWGDEAKARWRSFFPKSLGGGDYRTERDKLRAENENARKQHPYLYGAGDVAGSVLPIAAGAALTGGTSLAPALARMALPLAAGQGALQGAGSSNADSAGGLARDASVGGGLGALGYGVGSALGSAGGALLRYARGKAALATSRAAEKAAQEVAEKIASARGSLGGEVQKGQRIVENLRRLGPTLTPEEQAAAVQLEQRLTQSTREALPGQAETIATKDAELAALKSGASQAFNARKAELLSGKEVKQQLLARAIRYGPVAAGSAIGHYIGGPIGGTIGAVAGAGTRPMIHSMRRMAQNPAVQKAVFEAAANAADSGPGTFLRNAILQSIARGAPAVATQQLVTQ